MNRKYIVELSEEEKQELIDYCKKGMVNVRKYKRAAILLKADRCRYTTEQICEAVQVSSSTVFRVLEIRWKSSLELLHIFALLYIYNGQLLTK